MRCSALAASLFVALLLVRSAPAQIVLRGGTVLDDQPTGVTPQGVTAAPRLAPSTTRIIPWDMVREVRGPLAADAAPFANMADAAWRARSRWIRADYAQAEPLLNELFQTHRHQAGPLTLRLADGLLRCRLVRGDQHGAVVPWLTALRLRDADAGLPAGTDAPWLGLTQREESAPPQPPTGVIDPETGLCPALPPVWINADAAAALAAELLADHTVPADAPAGIRELAILYTRAAALETDPGNAPNLPAMTDSLSGPSNAGLALVLQMVRSRDPDPQVRASARSRLSSGLSAEADTWKEAWRRAALGRSLLMENDDASRSEGLFHLLNLPARFKHTQPYLAGVAIIEAGPELRRRGPTAAAVEARLIADLKLEEPFHPALRAVAAEAFAPAAGVPKGRP